MAPIATCCCCDFCNIPSPKMCLAHDNLYSSAGPSKTGTFILIAVRLIQSYRFYHFTIDKTNEITICAYYRYLHIKLILLCLREHLYASFTPELFKNIVSYTICRACKNIFLKCSRVQVTAAHSPPIAI